MKKRETERKKYLDAILEIYAIMGPTTPDCIHCDGCESEWFEVLRVIEKAITKERLKELFPHKFEKKG